MPYRTVVEEPFFVTELDALKKEYPSIYDVKDAVCWELCRRPEAGVTLENDTKFRVFVSFAIGSTPSFQILYRYNENEDPRIFLLRISAVRETEE